MFASLVTCLLFVSEPEPARAELDAAIEAVQREPDANLDRLAQALAQLDEAPDSLRGDANALAVRARARLLLAQLYLASGERERAAAVMDLALLESWAVELPVAEFGPSVATLHQQRATALREAGRAQIVAYCSTPCRLYVDEWQSPNPTPALLLGVHRVVITDLDGGAPRSELVELREAEANVELHYHGGATEPDSSGQDRRRPALTIAGATLLAVGAATLGFGVYQLSLEPEPFTSPLAGDESVYDHRRAGGWLLGTGLAVATAGAVLVVFGELRGDAAPTRPTLAVDATRTYFGVSVRGRF